MTVQVDVKWRLLVSVGARWCLFVFGNVIFGSGHVPRLSEECPKGYVSALYGIA